MLQALRFNIVGSDESSSAFAAVRREVEQTKSAFNSVAPALAHSANSFRLNTFQMQNMAFQMNDMAVMLASGQSPFVMLMQQGMQISQLFGTGVGVGAALKATGTALVSFLLNPLNLAVLGFAAAAGAAAWFFKILRGGSGDIEASLKTHKELIDRITAAYGGASIAAEKYGKASHDALTDTRDVQKDIEDKTQRLARSLSDVAGQITAATFAGPGDSGVTQTFGKLTDDAVAFAKAIRDGNPDLETYRQKLLKIATDPSVDAGLRAQADGLLAMTGQAAALAQALGEAGAALEKVSGVGTRPLTSAIKTQFGIAFGDISADPAKDLADKLKAFQRTPTRAENKISGVVDSLTLQTENLQRTNREQAIYNALAQAGVDINSISGQMVSKLAGGLFDQQQALSATISKLDEMRTSARDVLGTFVEDLRQGKTLVESLGDAFQHLADRLISSGLDSIVNSIFGQKGSASGGAGIAGSIGGFIGSLFGFANGGSLIAGGGGGPDSQLLMAKVSPGERIDFTPRGKSSGGDGSAVIVHVDPSPYFDVRVREVAGPQAAQIAASTVSSAGAEQQRRQMRSS